MVFLKYPLVLASASPRRKEILQMVGLDFEVVPSLYVEPSHSTRLIDPQSFSEELAFEKGKEVYARLPEESLVLAADTIGVLGHQVLEKPKDKEDARRMLKMLSGKQHTVITSIALFSPKVQPQLESVSTKVTFHSLSEEDIERYLQSAEYEDKAASYAIQGKAAVFVEKIMGDYWNVVGLPIATVWKLLKPYQGEIN
jgi:septum formation protein